MDTCHGVLTPPSPHTALHQPIGWQLSGRACHAPSRPLFNGGRSAFARRGQFNRLTEVNDRSEQPMRGGLKRWRANSEVGPSLPETRGQGWFYQSRRALVLQDDVPQRSGVPEARAPSVRAAFRNGTFWGAEFWKLPESGLRNTFQELNKVWRRNVGPAELGPVAAPSPSGDSENERNR